MKKTSYAPAITSPSTGFVAENAAFVYAVSGKILFISGRFNITNVGNNAANSTFSIALPSGYSCSDFVGSIGSIHVNKTGVDLSQISVRQGANYIYAQYGAGSATVLGVIGTGYLMVDAVVFLD